MNTLHALHANSPPIAHYTGSCNTDYSTAYAHDVCNGVDLGPGVHDEDLLAILVGLEDGLEERGRERQPLTNKNSTYNTRKKI